MIRPVGVGFTSRGPIGVDGLTMTAGQSVARDHRFDQALCGDLAALIGADALSSDNGEVSSARCVTPDRAWPHCWYAPRADSGTQRLLHEVAGAVDVGGINFPRSRAHNR